MRGVYLASVWLHILAAMTWIGGMVAFVAAVMPYFRQRPEEERARFLNWFGARFRVVSWWCFGVLLVTGTFNLWARGVSPGDLFRPEWRASGFGSLALIKLSLVTIAIAVSAAHERISTRRWARWMGRALLLIGFAIVAVAVLLVRAS
jgi:putative copper export protein